MAINYNIQVTGDCSNQNTGVINLSLLGGTPPYTVQFISPYTNTFYGVTNSVTVGNLGAATYSVTVNDSSLPDNEIININIPISNGVCASVQAVQSTTCDLINGSVSGTSTSLYSSTNYYLFDTNDNYITSAVTNVSQVVFNSLSAGTYYLLAEDLGGCTGRTPSFIIEESTPLDFGFYVVPNSSCGGGPIGKLFITGVTGTPPYSYLWSGGQTGSTITGLTSGSYSVQVTDVYGCVASKQATITDVPPVGLCLFTSTPPSCFSSDGTISITVTGGTVPYYYSASTGQVAISYSQTYTLTGLGAGQYNFLVTDAGLCTLNAGTTLSAPDGIDSVTVTTQNSFCSANDGTITVALVGGTAPYTYTLVYPGGQTLNITNSLLTQVFSNLESGNYLVSVSDSTGCSYMEQVSLLTENKFTINSQITGTTCNQNNGIVKVVSTQGGTLPLDYSLDGIQNVIDTNQLEVTFNNVSSGPHVVTVTDAFGCVQTNQIIVPSSEPLIYSLYSTSCGSGSNGNITAFISSGTPPFTFYWSENVSGNPQQIQVSGLTAGTYSLTIVDSFGCSLTRSTTIDCDSNYTSYQTYVMGEEIFNIQSPTKLGLLQMLNEGYSDLTSGNTSCSLISATFTAKVSVNPLGINATNTFFVSTSLINAPTDNLWYNTITSLLLSIPGIGNVSVDPLNNQITIATKPGDTSLNGQEVLVELIIVYDIICLT